MEISAILLCFFSSGTKAIFSWSSASLSSIFLMSFSPRSDSPTAAASKRIFSWISSMVAADLKTTTGIFRSRIASTFSLGSHSGTATRSGCKAAISSTDGLREIVFGIFSRTHGIFVSSVLARVSLMATMRFGSTRPSIISSLPAPIVRIRWGLCKIDTTVPSASVTL